MIRDATPDDVDAIADLIRGLAAYEQLDLSLDVASLRSHLFGQRRYAEALIAEADDASGAIVGYALFFHNYSTFLTQPGIYLEDLFVRPEQRGHGYGKTLLARLAAIAVERRCGRLEWSVLNWNAPSIAFYRSLGAAPMEEWTGWRLADDALRTLAGSA